MSTLNRKVKNLLLKGDDNSLMLYDLLEASPFDLFYDKCIVDQDTFLVSDKNEAIFFLAHQSENTLLIEHMWEKHKKYIGVYLSSQNTKKYVKKICQNALQSKNTVQILVCSISCIKSLFNAVECGVFIQDLIRILLSLPISGVIKGLYDEGVISQNDVLLFSQTSEDINGEILTILESHEDIIALHRVNTTLASIEETYRDDLLCRKRGVSVKTKKQLSILNTLLRIRSKSLNRENIEPESYLLILKIAKYYEDNAIISEAKNNMFIDKFNFYMSLKHYVPKTKVKERI